MGTGCPHYRVLSSLRVHSHLANPKCIGTVHHARVQSSISLSNHLATMARYIHALAGYKTTGLLLVGSKCWCVSEAQLSINCMNPFNSLMRAKVTAQVTQDCGCLRNGRDLQWTDAIKECRQSGITSVTKDGSLTDARSC